MPHRKLKRPKADASAEEVAAYHRTVAVALVDLGVDYGEEFIVLPAAEVTGSKLYKVEEPGERALGGFRQGSDSARKAALDNYPRSGTQRELVLLVLASAGERGMTSDEIAREEGINLYSVKPRLIELREGGWAEQNGKTRPSPRGSATDVYVATAKGREAARLPASRDPARHMAEPPPEAA